MAIIYSYSKANDVRSTDTFIISRFNEEDLANPRRTMSVEASTLADYFSSDIPAGTLNEVLTVGNESLLNANVGSLGLWDNPNGDYATISASDSLFTFYDYLGNIVAYIDDTTISLKRGLFSGVFSTSEITASRYYDMPDASGTVALVEDIPQTVNYGLVAQISSSTPIVNTADESSLISNEYRGSLTVPANIFKDGDSFKASLMGHISCLGSATLKIRIRTADGVELADTGTMELATTVANHWKLDIEFTIRKSGEEGNAVIVSGGSFSYNREGGNNIESFTFVSINGETFDTTIPNELVITAQWNNASASNSIYSDIFTLNKVY